MEALSTERQTIVDEELATRPTLRRAVEWAREHPQGERRKSEWETEAVLAGISRATFWNAAYYLSTGKIYEHYKSGPSRGSEARSEAGRLGGLASAKARKARKLTAGTRKALSEAGRRRWEKYKPSKPSTNAPARAEAAIHKLVKDLVERLGVSELHYKDGELEIVQRWTVKV